MEGRKRKLNHPLWSHHQGLPLVRPPSSVTSQTMNRQHVSLVPRIRPKPRPRHGPYYLQNNNHNGSSANQGNNNCRLANGDIGSGSPTRIHLPYGNGSLSSSIRPPPCPPPEDTVTLPQLPCCDDHPPQPPCIMRKRSNKVINNAVEIHKDTFCGDLFENFQRKQFFGSDYDEFDEIQNQLKAICFAKPEILTSTLTLTALNSSKIPLTEDDLLRKYQSLEILDSHNGMHHNKEKLPSKKKTTKVVVNSGSKTYFPRNPLPFEKVFDISTSSNPHKQAGDTKRQKLTEVNNGNNKTNAECQTEEIASLESWLVTTTSKKIGTTDHSKEMKIKQVESTKQRKQKKTKAPVRPTPMGIATTLTPRPSPINKEPIGFANSSPFAWLDEYFTTKLS